MEKRALLAAVLMAVVFIVYQTYFMPEAPPPPKSPPTAQAPPVTAPPSVPTPPPAPVAPPRPAGPRPPQRLTTVDTPLYRAVVSSEGGKLQDFTLKYRGDKPQVIVGDLGPSGLLVSTGGNAAPSPVPMTPSAATVTASGKPETLTLEGEADGLRVRQTFQFDPASYIVMVNVRLENPTGAGRTAHLEIPWSSRAYWTGTTEKFPGQHPIEIVWSVDGHVDRAPHWMNPTLDGVLESPPKLDREGDWIGIGSLWYLAALMPKAGGFRLGVSVEKPPDANSPPKAPAGRVAVALRANPEVAPGGSWEGQVAMFVGPKEYHRLKALGLEDTINFGGFPLPWYWGGLPMRWVGVPILLLMQWVYHYVGNYGVAIILLTVVSKVLFYPLTVKSMRSMKAMQALQPQVNALRSKYQKDPQTLQRETLALYQKHKVNPMGGCLPMVAQVPIFYALYLALLVSVELQNAAFLCFGTVPKWVPWLGSHDVWICDLAAKDPTYVLPILMGVTMFIQQKMTPTVGDPRQARIMMIMPLFFTAMFLELASGLVLYWTVSNVLQILQQKMMDRPARTGATREAKDAGRA
jgi:YidC/Oxa1 family membrane protein insertase